MSNGSFESLNSNSVSSLYDVVNYWQPIDTNKYCDYLVTSLPPFSNSPYALGYQYPRTGNNYIITQLVGDRGYPRNRLKEKLKPGVTYCAKYYVVNTNNNPYATDGFGMYFADTSLDTITHCNVALSYLVPQVQNPAGNIITDTLHWIAITGTFVAAGNEKYLVLGNFKTDAATNTLMINPTYSLTWTSDICVDDVSCIELNLPAYAGRDTTLLAGDSLFLGREPDVGIDEACVWYKSPQLSAPFDTAAGFWVKPAVTTTYMVRQEICGLVKYDTVVVNLTTVGIKQQSLENSDLSIYPVPADEELSLSCSSAREQEQFKLSLVNSLGQQISGQQISFKNRTATVRTADLPEGVYSLQLISGNAGVVTKRFIISR